MRLSACFFLCLVACFARAEDTWQMALSRMPLGTNVKALNRSNCVKIMLRAFQSNDVVKALIFMPGATDEFYMFRRAKAVLTNDAPTLLDAVNALTNQSLIHATFHRPFLLLHSDEDPLEPLIQIKYAATVTQLEGKHFVPHALYNDRDWDFLQPIIQRKLGVFILPERYTRETFHFYRHSFAAWNLNGWEALRAIALAGKTKFTVEKRQVVFEGDERVMAVPKTDHYPFAQ